MQAVVNDEERLSSAQPPVPIPSYVPLQRVQTGHGLRPVRRAYRGQGLHIQTGDDSVNMRH